MISNIIPFMIFILFFFVLSFMDTFSIKVNDNIKKQLLFFSLCVLVVFAGCRWSSYEVGYDIAIFDYGTYKNIYNSPLSIFNFLSEYASSDLEIQSQEIGYVFYSSLCHLLLGENFNLYLLFTNFILIVLFYKSLKRNEINTALFYLFFFLASRLYLQYNFILLRQAIAMSIIWMWAFPLLLKGEKIKFILVVFVAATFHFTAIIALLSFFMVRDLNTKRIVTFIIIVGILNVTRITDYFILTIVDHVLSLMGASGGVGEKLSKYLLEGDAENGFRGLNMVTFIEALPFLYIVKKYKRILCQSLVGKFYHNMFYIFVLLLVITMNFGFLTRMCQYFIFSYFFLISFYYRENKDVKEQRMLLFLFSNYLVIYSVRYIFIWFYSTEYSFFLFNL